MNIAKTVAAGVAVLGRAQRSLRRRVISVPDAASPDHHRAVIDAMGEGVLVQDTDGRVVLTNSSARVLVGIEQEYGPATLPDGWSLVDAHGEPLSEDRFPGRRALRERRPVVGHVVGLRSTAGDIRWLEVSAHPITAAGGHQPYAVVSAIRDVTVQRQIEERLRMESRLLDSVGQAVVAWDNEGLITFINKAAEGLYGCTPATVLGTHIADTISPWIAPALLAEVIEAADAGRGWEGEIPIRRPDGSTIPIWTTNTPVFEGERLVGHTGISVDISDRKATDALTAHRACHDPLTDLPTRGALVGLIDGHLSSDSGSPPNLSLILVDIGPLDVQNDAFGHEFGDRIILRCAQSLVDAVHEGDSLARFSDHTFAVCCSHNSEESSSDTGGYGDRLRAGLARSFRLAGIDLHLQVSAAVVSTTAEARDAAELLRWADTALSRARRDGTTQVYDQTMRDELWRRVQLEILVNRVCDDGRVDLGYQPVVRLDDQQTVGAETLLRLIDAEGVAVPAREVIEAAERSGRIRELGDLILRTACTDAARWQRAAPEMAISVAVNVSAAQLDDPKFSSLVTHALDAAGLDPSALSLEITESALMRDPVRSAALLAELKVGGVTLCADDFGTGYSSLAQLKALPLDVLKIDRSFVEGLPENLEDVAIIQAIMALADALGLGVVAEGIESEAQVRELLELGTACGQGWLWSGALSCAEFEARLSSEADSALSEAVGT